MYPNLNHTTIYISGSLLTLVCLITPLLFKKELKLVEKKYFLISYYFSVLIFFLTLTNPHQPPTGFDQLRQSIGSVNSLFLSLSFVAFLCFREREKTLFCWALGLTLVHFLLIVFHSESAYIAVSISLLYNLIAVRVIAKNIKNKADIGLLLCVSMFSLLLICTLIDAPFDISKVAFYDSYFLYILISIPAFISGSTIFIFLRYVIELNRKLAEQAHTDPLTKLYNRRFALGVIDKQLAYVERKSKPASIIMTDIDHFKLVNDKLGHVAGDQAISSFAQVIANTIREYDIACRYGGEEFLLFLPDTNSEKAYEVAERIRVAIAQLNMQSEQQTFSITASFGVAQAEQQERIEDWINRADKALYQSKQNGRNQVSIYQSKSQH